MPQDEDRQGGLDAGSKDRSEDKPLNIHTTSVQVSPTDDEALQCVNDLIRQIVATFEEEKLKQSDKQHDLLKQLNKPKQILLRLNTINVVNYLDEVNGKTRKTSVEAKETEIEENPRSVNVNEDLMCNKNDERKMTESSFHLVDANSSSEVLRQAEYFKQGEKGNGQNMTGDFCVKDISKPKKPLFEEMSKEFKLIQEIELYVNDLVKEVEVDIEWENLYAQSRKKYQFYESPEILKKTKRPIEINDATNDSKRCQVSKLSQTKQSLDFGKSKDSSTVLDDSDHVQKSPIAPLEQTGPPPLCDLEQKVTSTVDYLCYEMLSPISDDEDTEQSQEQKDNSSLSNLENKNQPLASDLEQTESSKVSAQSDYLEETRTSPAVMTQDDASKDNLFDSALPPDSFEHTPNTKQMNLEELIQFSVEKAFSLKRTPGTSAQLWRNVNETSETNTQPQQNINEIPATNTQARRNIIETPRITTRPQQNTNKTTGYSLKVKPATLYIKNIVQILMQPKQDSNAILHDLQIITYFIDAIGFLNDQLKTGIVTIFLEQRDLKRTTSFVYENYALLHYKRLPNLNINGIDARVYGKSLLQDLKNLKIKISLLFREYNHFRLKFLRNSLKFASIPFEFFIGDAKNSWIVSLAKSAAEKIVEEFKNKDELEDMHKTLTAARQKLADYVVEFSDYINSLDEISNDES